MAGEKPAFCRHESLGPSQSKPCVRLSASHLPVVILGKSAQQVPSISQLAHKQVRIECPPVTATAALAWSQGQVRQALAAKNVEWSRC